MKHFIVNPKSSHWNTFQENCIFLSHLQWTSFNIPPYMSISMYIGSFFQIPSNNSLIKINFCQQQTRVCDWYDFLWSWISTFLHSFSFCLIFSWRNLLFSYSFPPYHTFNKFKKGSFWYFWKLKVPWISFKLKLFWIERLATLT